MRKKELYVAVAQYAQLKFCQVDNLSLEQLIEEVILPKIAFREPHKISPDFMKLMTEFGQEIREENPVHGDALFAVALQRLFRDGSFFYLLPIYSRYCLDLEIAYGTRPLGVAEWGFLQKQGHYLLSIQQGLLGAHMSKIILDLIEKISPEGKIREDVLLILPSNHSVDGKILRNYAEKLALEYIPFSYLCERLATPTKWKQWPELFLNSDCINWKTFAKKIGIKGIFKGKKARCLLNSYVEGSV